MNPQFRKKRQMKRHNFLFEHIIDYNNIRLAFLKAIRGKRASPSAVNFCQNLDKNLSLLRNKLLTLNCEWGGYKSFLITDPKLRTVSTAPFEQRIMHHALMNILESVFERPLICHSYACRKGKGTHAAVLYAFDQCKTKPYFLKLDIRKYFDSIDHEILKTQARNLIKDTRVIALLDGIIDSYDTMPGKGVPIGNLTSQFFANLYLAFMDHYILEKLRPRAYCRYMDDFVLWSTSKEQLKDMFAKINDYLFKNLNLAVKPPVFGNSASGLPFLGFLIKGKGIFLLQKSKRRVTGRMSEITASLYQGSITEDKAAERVRSVFAALNLARTNRFRKILCEKGGRSLALTV
jgi:RNA-directed DNA polymerase